MTIRAALAAVTAAIALVVPTSPAHADESVGQIMHNVDQIKNVRRNDWCVQVDGQNIVCPPWGYLPYDLQTILPPDQ